MAIETDMAIVTILAIESIVVDPGVFTEFGSQVRREHVCKVEILDRNLRKSLDASDPSTFLPLSAPAPPPPPTTSSSSTLKADATDDLVVFNIAVGDVAILLLG